ncbi:hypothetical protein FG379_000467 [Cryptosporidium bovis]|uniref:uncharacterized protein n=1 Tax=Cryptosporidium bovis TaxID=310047 RepID=UPI00351A0B1A|nr:hypothetical protein FG379_000467 [Cryptosporidium bovis]
MNNLILVTMEDPRGINDTSDNLRDGPVNIERNDFGDGLEDEPSETNITFFTSELGDSNNLGDGGRDSRKTYSEQHSKFKLFIRRATTQRFRTFFSYVFYQGMLFKQQYQIIDNKYFIYKANKNNEAKEQIK